MVLQSSMRVDVREEDPAKFEAPMTLADRMLQVGVPPDWLHGM